MMKYDYPIITIRMFADERIKADEAVIVSALSYENWEQQQAHIQRFEKTISELQEITKFKFD